MNKTKIINDLALMCKLAYSNEPDMIKQYKNNKLLSENCQGYPKLIESEDNKMNYKDCQLYHVRYGESLLICFKGIPSHLDELLNINVMEQENIKEGVEQIKVNTGYYMQFLSLAEQLTAVLDEYILNCSKKNISPRILFCGHSLEVR